MSVGMHACVRVRISICVHVVLGFELTTTELCPRSLFAFSFEKGSYSVAQAALALSPKRLGSQACTTTLVY